MDTSSQKSAWDPELYARFRDERQRPFYDLLDLIEVQPAMRVVDLGCGTGELTQVLHRRLHALETLGVDNSETMLARSWAYAGEGLHFVQEDMAHFSAPGHYDLVFSNAALHWLPGHAALLRRLTASLAEGGQIAVQVPANGDQPSHTAAQEVAAESPFREALGGYVRKWTVLEPWEYAAVLHRLGFREPRVELRVYGHLLRSREDVVEWVRGTLLTDYRRRLPSDLFERFVARYREVLLPQLDDVSPYFFPFQRILMWGQRS